MKETDHAFTEHAVAFLVDMCTADRVWRGGCDIMVTRLPGYVHTYDVYQCIYEFIILIWFGLHQKNCLQCALMFAHNQIIDLYAPANLWEGCGSVQVMFHLSSEPYNFLFDSYN